MDVGAPLSVTEVLNAIDADHVARKVSKTNTTGLTRVIVEEADGSTWIVAIYLRGRKRYQGKQARDSVRNNLPPTV